MTDASKSLHDQVAVVAGATGGIGRAIALALAGAGAGLALFGRRIETLQEVADEAIRAGAPMARTYSVDLTAEADITQVCDSVLVDFQGVDLLVHGAGDLELGSFEGTDVQVLDRQYQVNIRGPFVMTQRLLPSLKARQGQVVMINSSVSLQPAKPNLGAYTAMKQAFKVLTDTLRTEVNAAGVRVLSIYPGRTASAMQEAMHAFENKPYQPERLLQPEDVAAAVLNAVMLTRTAEITDIAIRPFIKS